MKDLLDFRLPSFLRLNWTSPAAAQVWEHFLSEGQQFWTQLELRSVEQGVRKVALLEAHEVNALPDGLVMEELPEPKVEILGPPFHRPVAVGKKAEVAAFLPHWEAQDLLAMGKALGYPACCTEHFAEAFVASDRWYDPWMWAQEPGEPVAVDGPAETNILLHSLGLRLTPHIPCSPNCQGSQELAKAFKKCCTSAKESLIWARIQHVLAWPMTWSALHGIAEVKTPVFRISHEVAATGKVYLLERKGTAWPEAGAIGIRAPFQEPKTRRVTQTRGWQQGLQNESRDLTEAEAEAMVAHWEGQGPQAPEIDWQRVAVPQTDGYDLEKVKQCAAFRYACRGDFASLRPQERASHTFLEARIGLRSLTDAPVLGTGYVTGPFQHPNYQEAARMLAMWPEGYTQVRELVHTLQPYVDADVPAEEWHLVSGSCSHAFQHEFGIVHATIQDPIALAQALVHEMAHLKLFALGLLKEQDHAIILNPLDEGFPGTVRTDIPRPMSAILHAQYSFIHILELDLRMWDREEDPEKRLRILDFIGRNVPRMKAGHETIRKYARTDDAGEAFLAGFMPWSEQVIKTGQMILDSPKEFPPLKGTQFQAQLAPHPNHSSISIYNS